MGKAHKAKTEAVVMEPAPNPWWRVSWTHRKIEVAVIIAVVLVMAVVAVIRSHHHAVVTKTTKPVDVAASTKALKSDYQKSVEAAQKTPTLKQQLDAIVAKLDKNPAKLSGNDKINQASYYTSAAFLAARLNLPEAKDYAATALQLLPNTTEAKQENAGVYSSLNSIKEGDYSVAPQ
jgi:hypothetical protein